VINFALTKRIAILLVLGTAAIHAQAPSTPLPPNYKTIFENSDVLVMHVHYGAHEVIPAHDHPSVSTLYVYLNDSGEVDIIHEGPGATTAHRPPTHSGAFRIAPGVAERHSVQSNSDTDSDFLRVEFKRIALIDLAETGKHVPAPANPTPGVHTDYQNASLRIDRVTCFADKPCAPTDSSMRALLIPVTAAEIQGEGRARTLKSGQVVWLPAGTPATLSTGSQSLLVSFFTHE
jgi:quercetin dioxygenase-like cupin family protein